jgi:spermidine synthase
MFSLWSKQFFPWSAVCLRALQGIKTAHLLLLICLLTAVLLIFALKDRRTALAYAVGSTGFFGMFINLMLIFAFQVFYGYVYSLIGLLISVFMAGTALSALLMAKALPRLKEGRGVFLCLEAGIALFSLLVGCLLSFFAGRNLTPPSVLFGVLFFSGGTFLGLEFPLAAGLFSAEDSKSGLTAGTLYAVDLLGGWLAGLVSGVVFLPLLGLLNSCLVVSALKLSSAIFFFLAAKICNNCIVTLHSR